MTNSFIDSDMARILEVIRAAPKTDLRALPIDEARDTFTRQQTPWSWCPHALARVDDVSISTRGGAMQARLYIPVADGPLPAVVFAHGGGWTFGNIDTHDGTMRWLAAISGCVVLGINYRLSPEHPFPAGVHDLCDAIEFIRAGHLGDACDRTRIAVAGDSAGANIALGAMIVLRDAGKQMPATACLFYGCFAPIFDTASHMANGGGDFLLTTEMMRWYWANYLGALSEDNAPGACTPLSADLSGLPPLYLNAAALDPLLDDTLLMSAALARAGVRHTLDIWPGVVHGFLRLARELPTAQSALRAAGEYLKIFFNERADS